MRLSSISNGNAKRINNRIAATDDGRDRFCLEQQNRSADDYVIEDVDGNWNYVTKKECGSVRKPKSFVVWYLNNGFTIDDKYMIFESRVHTMEGSNLSKNYTQGPSIKIPLVDGVHMSTPIGTISVKRKKIIHDYKTINKWTDEDYNEFAKAD